jgi:oxygen-independent coproporphyrinogen-3 oxidase
LDEKEKYVEYLVKEFELYNYKGKIDTVYFGGGTPSLLSGQDVSYVLSKLDLKENAEITLELNPATADYNKLISFRNAGVNRLSIGIQTFNDELLKKIGRLHSSYEAEKIYKEARMAGFDNISLDLIFALPEQSMEDLEKDLKKVVFLNPEHISIYSLIWEEGTELWNMREKGLVKICDEDLEATMYEKIIDFLKGNNYIHYEISNFSKKFYESKHNSRYWENEEYIALGLGASYYYNNYRGKNVFDFKSYYKMIDNGKRPILEEEYIENKKEYEYMLGLRLLERGIEISDKDIEYLKICSKLVLEGYLHKNEKRYFLTKKGLFFANYVFECFIN